MTAPLDRKHCNPLVLDEAAFYLPSIMWHVLPIKITSSSVS